MTLRFQSILVSVTEGCHVGCHHCGFMGSRRDRETSKEEIAEWVGQICDYGIPTVIFTGGEPFESFDVLREGVCVAHEWKFPSAIFTSSYWASDDDVTIATLSQLLGVQHLYLSSDIFHQRRIPYENVYRVILAADKLGIERISICITYASDADLREVRSHYEQFGDRINFSEDRVIPTPYLRKSVVDSIDVPDVPEAYGRNCWIDTPIVNPNGDVFSCHAGKAGAHGNLKDLPYWIGNLRENNFREVMKAARNRLDYQYLRTHGPAGIANLYKAYPYLREELGRGTFTGPCDMCFSMLTKPQAIAALRSYVRRPEIVRDINMALVFRMGEPPIDDVPESTAM